MIRSFGSDLKIRALCHSMHDTIKTPKNFLLKAKVHRPSPIMATSPYEYDIFVRDERQYEFEGK